MKLQNNLIITLTALTLSFSSVSQSKWVENRKPFAIQEGEENYALFYLYRSKDYDYKYDEDGNFICDITYHEIVRVSNDDALESYNRIYIPAGNVIDILNVQSRTITKDGEIISLNQEDIKEVKDEENDQGYRIFAVEGAEVGGEIEYRYTTRVYGSTFVNNIVQFTSPVKRFDFSLKCPENLEFEFASINESKKVIQTDTTEEYNRYELTLTDIPELYNEGFSSFNANKKRIDFKLAYNSVAGSKRLNTFSDAGKRIYENATNLTKSESKQLSDFLSDLDNKQSDPIQRLRHFEHEIKQQFYFEENAPDDLEFLFKNNFGNERAFVKLFVGVLDYINLDYEIVVTVDRLEQKFNEGFDSWNQLDVFLIYIPSTDKFLAPHNEPYRYGTVPPTYTATRGLFIKPEIITDFKYPITRVDYIPEDPWDKNRSNIEVEVDFTEDLLQTNIRVKRTFTGSNATFYKAALLWMNQEQKDEMLDDLVHFLSPDATIDQVDVTGGKVTAMEWDDPFQITAEFGTEGYLEQAGNSVLFKVGELIGPQSEMYQEEERKFEIENGSNRGYEREIKIRIPEGYQVQNADDILINENVYQGEKLLFSFVSTYKFENDTLIINIIELYDEIYYPSSEIESFRKVINAAADWNKVILILK